MSTNCIRCFSAPRTGTDLLCDRCHAGQSVTHAEIDQPLGKYTENPGPAKPLPLSVELLLRIMVGHENYNLDEHISIELRSRHVVVRQWFVYRDGKEVNFANGNQETVPYDTLEDAIRAGLKHVD